MKYATPSMKKNQHLEVELNQVTAGDIYMLGYENGRRCKSLDGYYNRSLICC